ncbi:MAG: HlyD family efflux transporter periplasmic adaptor subunit [Anaerolineaceae bacterium]
MKQFNKIWKAVAVAILLAACSGTGTKSTPTLVPTPVTAEKPTYSVQRGVVTRTAQLNGRVTPMQQQDLFFRSDGFVKEVLVQVGDTVQEGNVLARLDEPERYQADVAEAELAYAEAQLKLEQAQLDAPIQTAETKKALEKARKNLKYVENVLEALKVNLNWTEGNAMRPEIEQAQINVDLAQGNYDKTAAELLRLQADCPTGEVALAKLALAAAEANLALAQNAQEAVELRAPFAGQVLSLSVAPGSSVKAFQAVLTLADPARLEIRAVPAVDDLSLMGIGQVAVVRLSSQQGKELPAKITNLPLAVFTASDVGSQDSNVHFSLEDSKVPLTLGDAATILVTIDVRENVLWLPPAAIRTFQSQDFVFVESDGVQRRVNVLLGLKSAERVEILSGLEEGQIVVGQ